MGLLHCSEHGLKNNCKITFGVYKEDEKEKGNEENGKKCSMNLIFVALCCLSLGRFSTLIHCISAGKYHVSSQ